MTGRYGRLGAPGEQKTPLTLSQNSPINPVPQGICRAVKTVQLHTYIDTYTMSRSSNHEDFFQTTCVVIKISVLVKNERPSLN
jgi:hypothetical protein